MPLAGANKKKAETENGRKSLKMGNLSTKTAKPQFSSPSHFAICGPILTCYTSKFLEDQALFDKLPFYLELGLVEFFTFFIP